MNSQKWMLPTFRRIYAFASRSQLVIGGGLAASNVIALTCSIAGIEREILHTRAFYPVHPMSIAMSAVGLVLGLLILFIYSRWILRTAAFLFALAALLNFGGALLALQKPWPEGHLTVTWGDAWMHGLTQMEGFPLLTLAAPIKTLGGFAEIYSWETRQDRLHVYHTGFLTFHMIVGLLQVVLANHTWCLARRMPNWVTWKGATPRRLS